MGHPPQASYSLQIAAVSPQWGHKEGRKPTPMTSQASLKAGLPGLGQQLPA